MEMMIVLLIVAVVAAAAAPMINKRMTTPTNTATPCKWQDITNGIAYNRNGDNNSVVIGTNQTSDWREKLVIQTPPTEGGLPQRPIIRLANSNNDATPILFKKRNSTFAITSSNVDDSIPGTNTIALGFRAKARNSCSVALGNAEALTDNSIAIGNQAIVDGGFWGSKSISSIAIGYKAKAQELNPNYNYDIIDSTIAIGSESRSCGEESIALGSKSFADGKNSISIGTNSKTHKADSIAIGVGADTDESYSAIAIGANSIASENSIAIGSRVSYMEETGESWNRQYTLIQGSEQTIAKDSGIAIGINANAQKGNSIALGYNSCAQAQQSIAIGCNAESNTENSVAIGYNALTTVENQIVLGGNLETDASKNPIYPTIYIPGNLVVGGNAFIGVDGEARNALWLRTYRNSNTTEGNGVGAWVGHADNSYLNVDINNDKGSAALTEEMLSWIKSDRRLKNVGDAFKGGLEEIKKLEVFNYTFKKDKNKTPRVGVMAQDLQKIFPNAVHKGPDGFLFIRMEEMFYSLVNAVKELANKFDIQDKRIEALEKQNKELQLQNKELLKRLEALEKKIK